MLLEAKAINEVRRDRFTRHQTLNKLERMYLEFILKETRFN